MSDRIAVCEICPHHCKLSEGQSGICRARTNCGGRILCSNYGRLTAVSLDRIEKKPLSRFYPGSRILSVGSYGCNLHCPFCQNHEISMADNSYVTKNYSPERLIDEALSQRINGNIGIAFTYNEPLISYEYVKDCSLLAKKAGLKTVLVTNGMICDAPLRELLPLIDAMNIDLKGYRQDTYKKIGGDLETVKDTIRSSAAVCHVEITTLIVPEMNDNEAEIRQLSSFLAGIRPDIPLHITRFFPNYRMQAGKATPVETVYHLKEIASEYLRYTYTGNC